MADETTMTPTLPRPKKSEELPIGPAVRRVQGKRTGLTLQKNVSAKTKKRYKAATS